MTSRRGDVKRIVTKRDLPFVIRVFVSGHEPHAHRLQIGFGQSPENKHTHNANIVYVRISARVSRSFYPNRFRLKRAANEKLPRGWRVATEHSRDARSRREHA